MFLDLTWAMSEFKDVFFFWFIDVVVFCIPTPVAFTQYILFHRTPSHFCLFLSDVITQKRDFVTQSVKKRLLFWVCRVLTFHCTDEKSIWLWGDCEILYFRPPQENLLRAQGHFISNAIQCASTTQWPSHIQQNGMQGKGWTDSNVQWMLCHSVGN